VEKLAGHARFDAAIGNLGRVVSVPRPSLVATSKLSTFLIILHEAKPEFGRCRLLLHQLVGKGFTRDALDVDRTSGGELRASGCSFTIYPCVAAWLVGYRDFRINLNL